MTATASRTARATLSAAIAALCVAAIPAAARAQDTGAAPLVGGSAPAPVVTHVALPRIYKTTLAAPTTGAAQSTMAAASSAAWSNDGSTYAYPMPTGVCSTSAGHRYLSVNGPTVTRYITGPSLVRYYLRFRYLTGPYAGQASAMQFMGQLQVNDILQMRTFPRIDFDRSSIAGAMQVDVALTWQSVSTGAAQTVSSSTVPGFYFYSTAGAYLGVASYCS